MLLRKPLLLCVFFIHKEPVAIRLRQGVAQRLDKTAHLVWPPGGPQEPTVTRHYHSLHSLGPDSVSPTSMVAGKIGL